MMYTMNTMIIYAYDDDDDDNDDDSYNTSSSSEEDYDYNTNVIIDMYGNKYTITDNGIVPCDNDDTPRTIQAAQRQINATLVNHTTTSFIKDFNNQTKREYPFMTKRFYVLKLST